LDATIIFIGSGSLVCLMPLAIYLLYLSYLNGRTPPTFVSGPWDLGAVLLGLSGFIILAGPLLITLVDSTWRSYAFGGWANLKGIGQREARAGSFMAAGYFILLGSAIPLLLRSRRRVTAIYNVASSMVESTLTGVLEDLGYSWQRARGLIEITMKRPTDPNRPAARLSPFELASVRVDTFQSVGNATLKWSGDWDLVRPEVESLLVKVLPPNASHKSAVAGWLFTAAVAIMIVMLLWLVVLIFIMVVPPPT
jgi:hypothetical protein